MLDAAQRLHSQASGRVEIWRHVGGEEVPLATRGDFIAAQAVARVVAGVKTSPLDEKTDMPGGRSGEEDICRLGSEAGFSQLGRERGEGVGGDGRRVHFRQSVSPRSR